MDFIATTTPAVDDLLSVQSILAQVTTVLDDLERSMPAIVCTWRGTARAAYGANLLLLSEQYPTLIANIANARAAVASAISTAS